MELTKVYTACGPARDDFIAVSNQVLHDKLVVGKYQELRDDELLQLYWSVELHGRRVPCPVTGKQFIDESDITFIAHLRKETAYQALILFGHHIPFHERDH